MLSSRNKPVKRFQPRERSSRNGRTAEERVTSSTAERMVIMHHCSIKSRQPGFGCNPKLSPGFIDKDVRADAAAAAAASAKVVCLLVFGTSCSRLAVEQM